MALPSSLDWVDKVSATVGFAEPLGTLQYEHIGLFWHRVRGEYPKVEQVPPLPRALSPERLLSSMSRGQFPMPGFRFSSVNGNITLLVRQENLTISWDIDPDEPIDFDGFFVPTFEKATDLFEDFIREELNVPGISADLCDITFSGEFQFPDGPPRTDSGLGILGILRAPDIRIPYQNPDVDYTYYYFLDSGLLIQVDGRLEFAEVSSSPRSQFDLYFKGSQSLEKAGGSDLKAWLNSAHQSILSCYLSLSA